MPRISQLPSLTTAANEDELPIVDVSASTTNKITRGDLLKAPLPTDSVTTAAIADNAVTTAKIADSNVTPAKLDFASLSNGIVVNSSGTIATIPLDYSTSEVNTGQKWIDGKTIYRRTFTGTITAAATSVVTTNLIASGAPFSQLIRGYGTWRKNAAEHVVFSGGWNSTNTAAINWNQSSGNVQMISSSDAARTNAPYQITLEYTKP